MELIIEILLLTAISFFICGLGFALVCAIFDAVDYVFGEGRKYR